MQIQWTKFIVHAITVIFLSFLAVSCSTSVDKVVSKKAPTMEQVYDQYTLGGNPVKRDERKIELLKRTPSNPDLQLGAPPYPDRLSHLYPSLPNPEMFMYVRPHAVGISGSPIPAYITRFTMYERQPYALPGETLKDLMQHVEYRQERLDEIKKQETLEKELAKKRADNLERNHAERRTNF